MCRVLRLLHRAEPGAPQPDAGADDAQDLPDAAPPLRPRARRLPDGGVRARRADLAARRAPGVLGSPRAARIHRRRRTRHRRSEDQRHQRTRQDRRGRLHDRVRPPGRRRLDARDSADVLGAGRRRRRVREEEPHHVADERRGHRHAARRHPERKADVGHRRDQGARSTASRKSCGWSGTSRSASTPSSRSASARAATSRARTPSWRLCSRSSATQLQRAKTNIGLGRVTNQAAVQAALEMAKP